MAFTGTVATFTDSNPLANKSNITAVINWGPFTSSGTITGPDANGVYTVTGTYTYFNASPNATYPVTVTIMDPSGQVASVVSTAVVGPATPNNVAFTGGLALVGNGPNAAVGYTNTNRPTFSGTANPYSIVQVLARLYGVDATESLGQAIAGPNGVWSLVTGPLAKGIYSVTAILTTPGGPPSGQILLQNGNPVFIMEKPHAPVPLRAHLARILAQRHHPHRPTTHPKRV